MRPGISRGFDLGLSIVRAKNFSPLQAGTHRCKRQEGGFWFISGLGLDDVDEDGQDGQQPD